MNNIDISKIDNLISQLKKQGIDLSSLPTAIYARKSTIDVSNVSLKSQIESCKRYIEDCDKLCLTDIYVDENKSGYNLDRKDFQKLLSDVKRHKIRVVVAYSMDRISRNVKNSLDIDNEFEKAGAIFLYVTQSFEDNADGTFTQTLIRALDQRQPEKTSETAIRSLLKQADLHLSNGGVAPYGYKFVNKKYVVNEKEAPAVKIMFNGILSGMTVPEIIKDLTNKRLQD